MASPNTGIFAASFIDGFLQQKQAQKDRAGKNKIIKLQTKLIEQQLLAGGDKRDAQTRFIDILRSIAGEDGNVGEINPLNNPSQIDAGRIPPPLDIFDTGLGRDFVSPTQNIPGQESSQNPPDLLATIVALQDNPGILRDNPELVIAALQSGNLDFSDLIRQQGQDPTRIRELRLANIDPTSPRGQEAILRDRQSDPITQLLLRNQLAVDQQKLKEVRIVRAEKNETIRQESETTVSSIETDFSHMVEIIQRQEALEGNLAASGVPFNDLARNVQAGFSAVVQLFGGNAPTAQTAVDNYDRLTKLFNDGFIESTDRLKGTMTNIKFNALNSATANIGATAKANAQLLADRVEALLEGARIKRLPIKNRARMEAWVKATREKYGFSPNSGQSFLQDVQTRFNTAADAARPSLEFAANKARSGFDAATVFAQDAAVTVSEIAKMKFDELQQIDFRQLSEEARSAVTERWGQLIAKMSLDELQKLDLKGMGEDALRTAEKRWKELNAK